MRTHASNRKYAPDHYHCDCGQPAAGFGASNDPICQSCAEKEEYHQRKLKSSVAQKVVNKHAPEVVYHYSGPRVAY